MAVEGEWDSADPVGESRWMAKVAARAGFPQGFVARAFLNRGDVGETLAAHAGLPADRSPEGLSAWRKNMALAARAPNIAVKISGLGLAGRPWRAEDNVPVVRQAIEMFGVDRCMFASNFPVDKLCGEFGVIFGAYLAAAADLSAADRMRLFRDNAVKIYRLDIPKSGPGKNPCD